MKTLRTGLYPAGRLHNGAAILSAAQRVDVTLVQKRRDAFAKAHHAYAEAHAAVEAAEAQVRGWHPLLAQRDAEQDAAVETLARALVNEGQPRTNPFEAFGVPAPSAVKKLNFGEKAKAIHTLASTVQADPTVSDTTKRAAQAADEAARHMEAELVPFDQLQSSLLTARDTREAAGKAWDNALNVLKRGARAADDDGAPGLYAALFGRLQRPNGKRAKPAPTPLASNGADTHAVNASQATDSQQGA